MDVGTYKQARLFKSINQYVSLNNDVIKIGNKYNATQDLIITFAKGGINQLMGIGGVSLAGNTDSKVNSDPNRSATVLQSAQSDWIGPYILKANANGDATPSNFTGGWHGTTGSGTGNPTARMVSYHVYADGVEVTDGQVIGCNRVDIIVVNMIQGCNTMNLDQREIMQETVHYSIQKGAIEVITEMYAPIETIIIQKMYGIQTCQDGYGAGTIHFRKGDSTARKSIQAAVNSGAISTYPNVDRYCIRSADNEHNLIAWLDQTLDLGTTAQQAANVDAANPGALVSWYNPGSKAYFSLINGAGKYIGMAAGVRRYYRGGYVFTAGENFPQADLAYYYNDSDVQKLRVDFLGAGAGMCPVPPNLMNKVPTIELGDAGVTIGARTFGGGLSVTATGYGSAKISFA